MNFYKIVGHLKPSQAKMDEYDSRHGKGASCSEAENCKDEFMTAVEGSYREFDTQAVEVISCGF